MNTICPRGSLRMPRTRLRVVWGTGLTIETLPPQRAFTRVDLPDEGRPTTATTADFTGSAGEPAPHVGELAAQIAEDIHEHRIELGSGLSENFRHRALVAPGLFVRPGRRERVVDVGDGRNPRGLVDLLSGGAFRVPLPVEALVVGKGDRRGESEE